VKQETLTKLSLTHFFRIMGVDPLHAYGIQLAEDTGRVSCDKGWPQYDWQNFDTLSREGLAMAIRSAEDDIENMLRTRLLPTWEIDERVSTARPNRKELLNVTGTDIRGHRQRVKTRYGNVISGGIRSKTLVEAAAAIVFTSEYLPTTYNETATVTVTVTAGTDPEDIRAYMPGASGADTHEIRPIDVSVSGTTATITFRRELAVDPDLYEAYGRSAWGVVDGETDGNFVSTVDVYTVENDPQTQISFLWEPLGLPCDCQTTLSTCLNCAYTTQTGCFVLHEEPKLGLLAYAPGTWNSTTEVFDSVSYTVGRNPDQLRLWYYAGLREEGQANNLTRMSNRWAQIVARMAAARLDRHPCSCNAYWWEHWAQDLAFVSGATELAAYNINADDLSNPFGTRRGEVWAWQQLKFAREQVGGAVGV
jgi:hypothetical protein